MPMGVYDRSKSRPRKDIIDMTGKKFGRLTVLKLSYVKGRGIDRIWLCQCDCGNVKEAGGHKLRAGQVKSCGCLPKERMSILMRKAPGEAARNSAFFGYRAGAKRRGIKFELTLEEFICLVNQDCFYCGTPPSNVSKSEHNNGDYVHNGIDRKNNDKGYSIENCVPCCIVCNRAKNSLSYKEFMDWIMQVAEYNSMKIIEEI